MHFFFILISEFLLVFLLYFHKIIFDCKNICCQSVIQWYLFEIVVKITLQIRNSCFIIGHSSRSKTGSSYYSCSVINEKFYGLFSFIKIRYTYVPMLLRNDLMLFNLIFFLNLIMFFFPVTIRSRKIIVVLRTTIYL